MSIREIIDQIPTILEYFIPGYISIYVYNVFRNKKTTMSETIHFGACVIISFIIRTFISLAGKIGSIRSVFSWVSGNAYIRCFIASIIGIVVSIVLVHLREKKGVRKHFEKIANVTLSDSVFETCDLDKPDLKGDRRRVTIYGDNYVIYGRLLNYDLEDKDAWICMDLYEIKDEGTERKWFLQEKYERCLISVNSIRYIIAHYKGPDYDTLYPDNSYEEYKGKKLNEIEQKKSKTEQ